MTINDATTVGEIVAAMPASARVFQQHGVDFCCGGKRPLAAVCRERGLSFPELVGAIENTAADANADPRDWNLEPMSALIDHIVATYHEALRRELPRLEELAAKVERAHGAHEPHLTRLKEIVAELSTDLQSHMQKEELVLFPAIRAVERGTRQSLLGPIAMMEHEHVHAGNLLDESRDLTRNFTRPDWACGSVHALYGGLAELDAAMRVHVHLENNILFPRAQVRCLTV
jgi:regulator of cell morphogenesis and NO signaling